MEQVLWSLLGLVVGFLAGYGVNEWQWRRRDKSEPQRSAVIVEDNDDGKPDAREVLVKESPIPRALVAFLVILGCFTIAATVYEDTSRRDDDASKNRKICQLTAQIKLRQDDGLAANAQVAKALAELLASKDSQEARDALGTLEKYYQTRSVTAKTLPPLPSAVIQDCKDGTYDGEPS